jgi:hypothetical protein
VFRNIALVFWLVFFVLSATALAEEYKGIDPERVKEIAAMLSEKPIGFGRPISDRVAWDKLAKSKRARGILARAEKWLETPIYEMSDEMYLDYLESGSRKKWNDYRTQSKSRLIHLVFAECIENKGRFLADIERTIRVICAAKTWMMPPHDLDLGCFHGRFKKIDLNVTQHLSFELATCDYFLADKLSPEIRKLIRAEIKERTFDTLHDVIDGKNTEMNWFLTLTNNWAAVCYNGVLGASQLLIEPREERAFFVAFVEHYIQNYINGFTDEGYCWEGLGYWTYGFSNFIVLSETIYQATGGKIDLLDNEKIKKIAKFGARMEIHPNVYPAFADCSFNIRPGSTTMNFVSKKYGLGLKRWEKDESDFLGGSLYSAAILIFPNSTQQNDTKGSEQVKIGAREWFKEAGTLICRPIESKKEGSIAAAIKGGCNGESHNHHDVGTFVVVKGKEMLLVDPGGEVYTLRTFSKQRYDSKVLNSYGHPVPVVAGKLQRAGKDARAQVMDAEFSDQQDKLVFDISSAYDVNELEKLERTYVYSRTVNPGLTVIDEVCFSEPKSFGTALITYGEVQWSGDGNLIVSDGEESVKVNIAVTGGEFEIVLDTIIEDMNNKKRGYPKRIGINLKEPIKEATVKMVVTAS